MNIPIATPTAYKKVRLKTSTEVRPVALWRAFLLLLATATAITSAQAHAHHPTGSQSTAANRPPRFLLDGQDQSEIVLRLREGPETPAGSRIYTLRGHDPDGDALTFGIRYNPYDADVLRIERDAQNATVAHLYLERELDRELRDEYVIVLTLTDQRLGDGNYVTQSLLLLVEDINDNVPVFRPYQSQLEVAEDAVPGVLTTLEATDADEGAYGQVVYYLQELDASDGDGGGGVFSISTHNGRGTVRLVRQLDYEQKSLYQLRVLAVDRANQGPVNTATAALLVRVRDVEDQPPQFAAINPVVRVPEDIGVGAPVVAVRAFDGDRGVNNAIEYAIARGAEGSWAVDGRTGWVRTTRLLDREDARSLENGAFILEIVATERGSKVVPAPSATTEITIILIDINDETPRFRAAHYEAEISEAAQENTPLTFLGASAAGNSVFDYDQGLNGTFELHLEPDDGLFEITPARAVNEATFLVRVRRNQALDFERQQLHNYTIVAREVVRAMRDTGGGEQTAAKWSRVPLAVYVRDSNDNMPEFERGAYEFQVPENSGAGTVIGRVRATDRDAGPFGTAGVRYTQLSGSVAHLLQLDAKTGVITIRSPGDGTEFDRETIASHHLTVEARDNLGTGNRNTVPLVLQLLDVNDNAPVFAERQYEAKLLENQPQLESALHVRAKDADQPGTANADVWYEIVNAAAAATDATHQQPAAGRNATPFAIDPRTGRLSVVRPLDFETEAVAARRTASDSESAILPLYLTIVARDRGQPALSARASLVIYLHDVNDHAPQFSQAAYAVRIREDHAGGAAVVRVHASDRDASAPNNAIVYRIQSGAADKFRIDAESGVISVAAGASLDPDQTVAKTAQYALVVLALDGGLGEHQRRASALVNISIADVNNKAPVIAEPERVRMLENTGAGALIARVHATDADADARLRFAFDARASEARNEEGVLVRASEYDAVAAFAIDARSGDVRVVRPIDRERIEQIRLAVVVVDEAAAAGPTNQTATAFLQILVEDVNDNNPHFRRPVYTRAVAENSAVGTAIVAVAAYDVDKNRSITYELDGPRAAVELVHIDAATGEMVVAQRIDHEAVQWLNYTVRATDSGWPARSAMVDVFVRVIDENDNNPYFVADDSGGGGGTSSNLSVVENCAVGTRVAMVRAADADSGDFGKITYLIDKMSSQGKFTIDADTGVLSVAAALDREERGAYMVVIEAWDNYQFGYLSGESRNAFKQFYINILDENDSPPVLQYPTGAVQISEYHDLSEPVAHVRATDADDPATPNGRVALRIASGSGAAGDLFRLQQTDAWNAVLYAKRSLHDYYGNYTVRVEAHDLGEPRNTVLVDVLVAVLDFNDHAPYFVAPGTNVTVRVPENATIGTHITQVRAADDDIGPNAAILYRFKPDALGHYRHFHIDASSGEVSLRLPLDRQHQKLFALRIEAYDQGIPPLTSDLDIAVYVRNVCDYEPQFLVDAIAVNFTEHAPPGAERIQLPDTVDRDEVDELDDPPSAVCYFIVWGNADGRFALDARTHVLRAVRELDREQRANHTLVVRATERCDRAPEPLDLAALRRQAREDAAAAATAATGAAMADNRLSYQAALTRAARPEAGSGGRAERTESAERFNRFKHSRSLRSVVADEDASPMTGLQTLAFDAADDDGAADGDAAADADVSVDERRLLRDLLQTDGTLVQLHVRVLDINDHAPVFASKVFTGGLTTTADFGTVVMHVRATDADEGANARVAYALSGDVHRTLAEGLDHLAAQPFLVDARTGAVQLNFDPQRGMKGYFDFIVLATDAAGQQDRAHVFIYLLRADQRVRFVLRQQPAAVRAAAERFRRELAAVTGHIVNVDEYRVHETRDGGVDKTKTDLYLHLVDGQDNSILEVEEVLQLIDQNVERLDGLFREFAVLDTQPAELELATERAAWGVAGRWNAGGPVVLWLVLANVMVTALLVVVVSLCFSQRQTYRRQLRAACVHSYVTSPSDLTMTRSVQANVVPNTNKHSMQGSNPIWMKAYANEWYKGDDDDNDDDVDDAGGHPQVARSHLNALDATGECGGLANGGFDSLDENVLTSNEGDCGEATATKTVYRNQIMRHPQLDAGVGAYNVYNHIDRMAAGAQALTKKLETTEL